MQVLYGSDTGLTGTGSQLFSQDGSIAGEPENGDGFGAPLTAGQLGKSGHDDLAVGVRSEVTGQYRTGGVNIIYGSAAGLTSKGNQFINHNTRGIVEPIGGGGSYGRALAVGNFGG